MASLSYPGCTYQPPPLEERLADEIISSVCDPGHVLPDGAYEHILDKAALLLDPLICEIGLMVEKHEQPREARYPASSPYRAAEE